MENKLKKNEQNIIMDNFVKTDDILNDMCGIIESSQKAAYQAAGDYGDATTKAKEAQYQKGESLLANHKERVAVQTFETIAGYRDAL